MSQLSGLATTPVDIGVDIDQKNFSEQRRQDGQGRRSRGGHVCPPCLDGPDSPDRHNGLGRPERAGLDAPSPFPQGWVRVVPPPCEDSREAGGVAVHEPCKCVTPFVDILRERLRVTAFAGWLHRSDRCAVKRILAGTWVRSGLPSQPAVVRSRLIS
jgi:hypothetical protein